MDRNTVLQNISNKEKIGGIIWVVISVIQLLIGITFNWVITILGIWNLIAGLTRISDSYKIEQRANNIVDVYEKSLTSLIIFIVLNILIGGIIGVIGAIYDFTVRSYVLDNRDVILGNTSSSYNSNSNKYEDLEKLMKLKESGALTEMEYEIEKKKLLR